ncbi:hypothetical protein PVL29_020091 [Vitis rotundifolia]|uniref:Cyanobacterial aminoacyl-tRNA synthetase CAAD domain-containing protein n=1 Tax=Vitis rotundifolia TaxID=103349 RepID=A0AA39DEL5_VITRO|nr:hypothetical protein PVL29_020091 [Vitis rotundifolia]
MASTTTPLSISSSSTLIDGKAPRQSAAASSQCVTLPTLPPPPVASQNRPGKGTMYCRKIARNVIAMATGEAPAEVGTTEVPEIIKTALEAAIDKLPLVPGVLEIVGIGYSGWFAYKNLIFKPDREALIQKIKDTYKEIIGSS